MRALSPLHLLWLAPSVLMLAWLEQQWPMVALVSFVLLTLTLGFAHGAMDIFLLRDAQGKLASKPCLQYAFTAACLAAALSLRPSVALIVLIMLSLWHFGEQAHFERADEQVGWLLRMVQGGSSVMLPALLSPDALMPWINAIAGADAAWVWLVWVGMAGLWCALLLAAFVLIKPWQAGAEKTLWIELIALLLLNALLSPLLAFALFFGLYHSLSHLWRMRKLMRREAYVWRDGLFIATMLLTWIALAALLWVMAGSSYSLENSGLWLRMLVVALAAVTLPHLILVSRSRQRLFV